MISARSTFTSRSLALRSAAVLSGSALMAMSAQVSVPMWPVPITAQTLALPLLVALLGRNQAVLALFLYLAEGALGLPVFQGLAGGMQHLVGPLATTGGYLWSYPIAAWALGSLFEHGWDRGYARRFAAIIATSAIVFALGTTWLAVTLHLGAAQAIALGVTPFIIGDLAKSMIAAGLAPSWKKIAAKLGIEALDA